MKFYSLRQELKHAWQEGYAPPTLLLDKKCGYLTNRGRWIKAIRDAERGGMILFSGSPFLEDIPMATSGLAATGLGPSQQVQNKQTIPLNKSLYSLDCEIRARVATGATAPGVVLPGGVYNLVQNLKVFGTHRRGDRVLHNESLDDLLKAWIGFAEVSSPTVEVNTLPAAGTAPAINTNFDTIVAFRVPFFPIGVDRRYEPLYLMRGPDWQTFYKQVTFGDASAVFAQIAGQVVTFTNYGGATGTPQLRVYLNRPSLGAARNSFIPGIVQYNTLPLDAALQGTNLTDSPIRDLNKGYRVRGYLIKTGTLAGGLSAGVRAFATLSDSILTQPKLRVNGTNYKQATTTDPWIFKLQAMFRGSMAVAALPVGYTILDFSEEGDPRTFFPGDTLGQSDTFQLSGDVTSGATEIGEVLQVYYEGEPVIVTNKGAFAALSGRPIAVQS